MGKFSQAPVVQGRVAKNLHIQDIMGFMVPILPSRKKAEKLVEVLKSFCIWLTCPVLIFVGITWKIKVGYLQKPLGCQVYLFTKWDGYTG